MLGLELGVGLTALASGGAGGGGGAPSAPSDFALVKYSGSSSTASPVSFSSATIDTNSMYDNATNAAHLVVPAGASLIRLQGGSFGSSSEYRFAGNTGAGAEFKGTGQARGGSAASFAGCNWVTGPIAVSPADAFEMARTLGTYADGNTMFAMEVLDPSTPYARVELTSNVTGDGSGWQTISWDQADVDTDSFWDGGNPSRLTVPEDGLYRIVCNAYFSNVNQQNIIRSRKNGASFAGMIDCTGDNTNSMFVNGMSAPIDCVAGDYFEMQRYCTNTTGELNANAGYNTWFSIERLPDDYAYCLVAKTNAQNATTGNPAVTWNTIVHDPLGIWDGGTSSNFTLPSSGYSYVRAGGNLVKAAASKDEMLISSVANAGNAWDTNGSTHGRLNAWTSWGDFSASDTFDMNIYSNFTSAIEVNGNTTWMCVELIP